MKGALAIPVVAVQRPQKAQFCCRLLLGRKINLAFSFSSNFTWGRKLSFRENLFKCFEKITSSSDTICLLFEDFMEERLLLIRKIHHFFSFFFFLNTGKINENPNPALLASEVVGIFLWTEHQRLTENEDVVIGAWSRQRRGHSTLLRQNLCSVGRQDRK